MIGIQFYDGVLHIIFVGFSNSMSMLLVISSLDIPVSHNVSTTCFLSLFKFSFSSLHNPVRTIQDLLEYISNSSVFAVRFSWKTDVTCLGDASSPSSAMTRSSNLTTFTSSSSIVKFINKLIGKFIRSRNKDKLHNHYKNIEI